MSRMSAVQSHSPKDGETIAELRELYRAAEARAARLRLLSVSGRELAEANPVSLDAALQRCAERLAFFVGCHSGRVVLEAVSEGIAIEAPGKGAGTLGAIVIDGLGSLDAIPDAEDREAFRMHLDLMGTTIDRLQKESERAELLARLQERERSLAILLERLFTAQEEERLRVSQELHDGVAQTATALVRLLEGAETARQTTLADAPKDVARGLDTEIRRVIAGLRPTLLDDLGFAAALQSLAEGLEAEGFRVALEISGSGAHLSSLAEIALFRVAQEAVTNIHKHAGGPCDVVIRADLDADPLVLSIVDFGAGPSSLTRASGGSPGHNVGIAVMKERMTAIGGSLDWGPGAKGGVGVEARLPLGELS